MVKRDEPMLLTVPAAARRLGVSERRIWRLIAGGRLQSVKEGRSRYIPATACAEYIRTLKAEQCQVA